MSRTRPLPLSVAVLAGLQRRLAGAAELGGSG
jgi:hypothetical protein